MNKLNNVLLVSALAFPAFAFGQVKPANPLEKPYIEVTGTAEKDIVPDEIYITIIIKEKSVGKEKTSVDVQEEKLRTALSDIGIDVKNLSLSDVDADYLKVRWRTKEVVTKRDYVLKVRTATEVGQVFQQLEKLEISDAYILRVDHSRIDSLRKEVRIMAIKAAKEKADYLLTAIREQTGKPVFIMEQPFGALKDEINTSMRNIGTSTDGQLFKNYDKKDEIQFKKIKISYQIYVRFEIK